MHSQINNWILFKGFGYNFSNATISAPPTTNNPSNNGTVEAPKSTLIATTGTTSKIMHPPEDISLEELRARKPKYNKKIASAIQSAVNHSGQQQQLHHQSHNTTTSTMAQMVQTSTASMVSHAHEVCFIVTNCYCNLKFFINYYLGCCYGCPSGGCPPATATTAKAIR